MNTVQIQKSHASARKFSVGDMFLSESRNEVFILAEVDAGFVSAISLSDGRRWQDPVKVIDRNDLTQEELGEIIREGTRPFDFQLLEKNTVVCITIGREA